MARRQRPNLVSRPFSSLAALSEKPNGPSSPSTRGSGVSDSWLTKGGPHQGAHARSTCATIFYWEPIRTPCKDLAEVLRLALSV
jgi:hypothetical protein